MPTNPERLAFEAVNQITAMVAYWDSSQRCVFSNSAYREWFGRTPTEMVGMSMKELLGPLYEKNLPYIIQALRGEKQVFERRIPLPDGRVKESIATYTPDLFEGTVRGFWVHVADVTILREREAALEKAIAERDKALAEVKTLQGLIPICAWCKNIRDEKQIWQQLESYVATRANVDFSHTICPACAAKHFGELIPRDDPTDKKGAV